jgi:hypothetical protein
MIRITPPFSILAALMVVIAALALLRTILDFTRGS